MSHLQFDYFFLVRLNTSTINNAIVIVNYEISYKGKAIPFQPWTGPEGSRRLRLPDFKTIGT